MCTLTASGQFDFKEIVCCIQSLPSWYPPLSSVSTGNLSGMSLLWSSILYQKLSQFLSWIVQIRDTKAKIAYSGVVAIHHDIFDGG